MTATVAIPTLETARLGLRVLRFADFDAYRKNLTSDRARFMEPGLTEKGAWSFFTSDVAHWTLFGFGTLMIEHRDSGETMGAVGISSGPLFPEIEIGWVLYDGAEGRGYATEAAGALRAWAYGSGQVGGLVSYIDPANAASIRVAERLGAVPDADAPRPDPEDLVYRHPSPEALQ